MPHHSDLSACELSGWNGEADTAAPLTRSDWIFLTIVSPPSRCPNIGSCAEQAIFLRCAAAGTAHRGRHLLDRQGRDGQAWHSDAEGGPQGAFERRCAAAVQEACLSVCLVGG